MIRWLVRHSETMAQWLALVSAIGLVVVAALSCMGEPPPDAHTSQGFGVYLETPHPVSVADLSRQADIQAEVASEALGCDVGALWRDLGERVSLRLTDEPLGPRGTWAGYTVAHETIDGLEDLGAECAIYWQSPFLCVGRSALAHELTHVALLAVRGNIDVEHATEGAWNGPGSITQLAMTMAIAEICPLPGAAQQ